MLTAPRSRILAGMLAGCATHKRLWRVWCYEFPNLVQFLAPVVGLLDAFADPPDEIDALMSDLKIRERLQHRRDRPLATTHPIHRFADFAWGFMVQWDLGHHSEDPAHHERTLRELFALLGIRLPPPVSAEELLADSNSAYRRRRLALLKAQERRDLWLYLAWTLEDAQPEMFLRPLDTPVDALRTILVREWDRLRVEDRRRRLLREWILDDPEFLDVGYGDSDDLKEKRSPERRLWERWLIDRRAAAEDELDRAIEVETTKARRRAVNLVLEELSRGPLPVGQRVLLEHWRAGRFGAAAAKNAAKQSDRPEEDWRVIHNGLIQRIRRKLVARHN